METKYKIKWDDSRTGASGEGDAVFDSYVIAADAAAKMNERMPWISHYIGKVETGQTQTKLNIPAVIVQLRLGTAYTPEEAETIRLLALAFAEKVSAFVTALDELELDAVYRVMDAHGVVL